MKKHYIYQHVRTDTNSPFYIGKGIENKVGKFYRAFEKSRRNNIWKSIVSKTDYTVEILFKNLSSEECFKQEIELIAKYGKIYNNTGILANYTDGGEGQERFYKGSAAQIEAAKKAREVSWHKPRTQKQLENIAKGALIGNPPKPIMQYNLDGEFIREFASASEASRVLDISQSYISFCCIGKKYAKTAGGFIWKFKNN